jgi:putative mycofactocin binding protein MftB
LLYHFGTRRLSFVKSVALRDVVTALESSPTARDAVASSGVSQAEVPRYADALAGLAATSMICERESA